jgi:hypothetical protein
LVTILAHARRGFIRQENNGAQYTTVASPARKTQTNQSQQLRTLF